MDKKYCISRKFWWEQLQVDLKLKVVQMKFMKCTDYWYRKSLQKYFNQAGPEKECALFYHHSTKILREWRK